MVRIIKHLLLAATAACALAACGDADRFAVEGTLEGGRSTNLRYVYYNGSAFMQGITAVRNGRFSFEGRSPAPAVIELYDNDYRLQGRLYAANGDKISCTIDPASPFLTQASGRKELERWTEWLRRNAGALRIGSATDSLVAAYVGANPSDVVSTLLLTTLYDASTPEGLHRADSLLALIDAEARPMNITGSFVAMIEDNIAAPGARLHDFRARVRDRGNDTVRIAESPLWLVAVSTEHSGRADSVVPLLQAADSMARKHKDLRVLDISLDQDTMAWRRIIRPDSARWMQVWVPGGTAARGLDSLGLPSLPYFFVADSTGRQLLRTPSASRARAFLASQVK